MWSCDSKCNKMITARHQGFGMLMKTTCPCDVIFDIRVVTCHSNDYNVMKDIITLGTSPLVLNRRQRVDIFNNTA